jgi:hypothetical protein
MKMLRCYSEHLMNSINVTAYSLIKRRVVSRVADFLEGGSGGFSD